MQRTPIVNADARRVNIVLAHRAAVIVEAPAGFGKSHLLRLLHECVADSVLITDHAALAAAADAPASTVLVDLVDPSPALIEHIAEHAHVDTMVVAGRVVGRDVRTILGRFDHIELTTDDLALTESEIAAMFEHIGQPLDPALAELIWSQTDGWPAMVADLVDHARAAATPIFDDPAVLRRGLVHHPVIDRRLRETVTQLPSELAHGLVRFGLLERFTATSFDAVTEAGALRRIVERGVPVLESADGWLRLPVVLRSHLGDEIAPEDAERIAPHLAQSGGLVPAARSLVASGSLRAAAQLILDTPRAGLDEAEPHALLGVLDAVIPVGERAALGLARARVHESLGEVQLARSIVDDLVADLDPASPGWVSARLEQLRHAAMNDDIGPDDELLLDLTTAEHQTRLREVLGLRAAQSSDPARVEEAIGLLETAAGEWHAVGDPSRAAAILRVTASIAHAHLGRYPEAIDAAGRARRLATHRLHDRALATVLMMRMAALAGRTDVIEREQAAAETLAAAAQLPWLEHQIAASMVHASALADRPADAAEWARRAEHTLGGLRAHSTATVFHAEMAAVLAVAGRHDDARRHLDLAGERRTDNPTEVAIAEAIVAARLGDTVTARQRVDELVGDPAVPETRRWRPQLELAIAEGDIAAIDAAKAVAQMVGLRDLADRLSAPSSERVMIRVLGGLEIRRGGQVLPAPTGKPAELLKVLVCRGGSITAEQAIDVLWDDLPSTEQGLRRLKNPLNRLREAVGADAIVRTSVGIHLGAGVDTDLARFTSAVGRATGGGGREASVAAVDALNLYEPLLPDEPASELIANRSADLMATASGLFDLVLNQPAEERPSSSWLLDTARRIDLYAEPWFATIAEIALEEHNLVHARQAVALARAAAVELDLADNPEIEVIAARLSSEKRHVHH